MTKDKTVVVIPTYNEKENISKLIESLFQLGLSIDVLVVDDNSPDGTGDEVESLKKVNPNVDIIHRAKKEGIGPAYIEAFRYLLNNDSYRYIVNMDADFSHNPKDVPRLLDAVKKHDVVVGSRYARGGGVSDRWNILRKSLSRFGNIYVKLIMNLGVNDCTSGFRCYKKEALKSIDFNKGFLNGYGFLIQVLYELKKNKFDVEEIPIFFDERRGGCSKMSLFIIGEAFFSLLLLKIKDRFLKK